MALAISDELLGTFVPIVVYWIYSGMYVAFGSFENYRLHSKKEEEKKNLVSKWEVIKNVLLQQTIQAFLAIILYKVIGNDAAASQSQSSSPFIIARQFVIAMLVLDTWQYFMHRYFHHNKFLYRRFHSHHHKLVVPYAFGAIYNHPLEAFVFDIIGGTLSYILSGMSPRTSIFFFSFATIKSVDDHCGLWLPGNFFHFFFNNNSAYHDVHHNLYGGKYNFSQPFFVMWDRIMGTYMPYSLEKRDEGGFQARPIKRGKE
ncbi:sphinganine C4-monooxygenase 1-like [Durio zibethinus]|uniref:Sphinganine C4-monooxygenase 1-like n=1 Tax=Durio zibethinus TaxID=66656 RepID=A0A6P6BFK2_DURZI|nr:sphinganine C4-monooxygenase 1-like [Durio zibethinus]